MKYYKHFTDASEDEYIAAARDRFGAEGYCWYFVILETIGKQMDYESEKCSVSYSWAIWQGLLRGKAFKIRMFLEFSQERQKLFFAETGNILEIKCPKLLELRDKRSKK